MSQASVLLYFGKYKPKSEDKMLVFLETAATVTLI